MTWIRVEDKSTGHQFDLAERAFDPEVHKKVNAPAQWPDLVEETDRPRPPLYRTDKAGQPAGRSSNDPG